ncbi:MAG: efflux RND transporter periplasmic adaptor subunit [Planctomyces sp.]|nr:efflux RND transporter periplasmic adaptor subunit [Planctomyces sp.]
MRRTIRWLLLLSVLGGGGMAASGWARAFIAERNRPRYKTARVERGDIAFVVNSTGTVKPVQSVSIGSFVSGPIEELFVDFNQEVKQGQLLARIDRKLYVAAVRRDEATLAVARAEQERVQAVLQQAINDEQRAIRLRETNKDFISDSEMDQYRFTRASFEAQLAVAGASIKQAEANLENSAANLGYADITSPVDGIVIDRKIDPGQTLAAAFQTPELFIVAPEMEKEMHVFASVDEADIGYIIEAQQRGQPVFFTVDAYPQDVFHGTIHQVRKSSTTTQNVVTYPVVVSAPNADLKLLPGMTANLSFQISRTEEVLKVPNSALRFYPKPEQVRPEDRGILELTDVDAAETARTSRQSAMDKVDAARRRNFRHVWIQEGDLLRAIPVEIGLTDSRFSQVISGDLTEGQALVTRLDTTPVSGPAP